MIESIFSFVQNWCDKLQFVFEAILKVVQYYAITYPEAFKIIVVAPIMIVLVLVFMSIIIYYASK